MGKTRLNNCFQARMKYPQDKLYGRAIMRAVTAHLVEPVARINNQTEIVNGERGHYLVWSVRVKG